MQKFVGRVGTRGLYWAPTASNTNLVGVGGFEFAAGGNRQTEIHWNTTSVFLFFFSFVWWMEVNCFDYCAYSMPDKISNNISGVLFT